MSKNSTLSVGQLSTKFQLTLPKPVRDHLNIKDRDRVAFVLNEKGEIVIQKVINV